MAKTKLCIILLFLAGSGRAQQIIPLYSGPIPNATSYAMQEIASEKDGRVIWYQKVSKPTLTIFLPAKEKASGAGVIIFPGGGYSGESYDGEGTRIAETFIAHGVVAFVVKYRLPSDSIMVDKSIGPLQDAQRAIQVVRARATEWEPRAGQNRDHGFFGGRAFGRHGGHSIRRAADREYEPYQPAARFYDSGLSGHFDA